MTDEGGDGLLPSWDGVEALLLRLLPPAVGYSVKMLGRGSCLRVPAGRCWRENTSDCLEPPSQLILLLG